MRAWAWVAFAGLLAVVVSVTPAGSGTEARRQAVDGGKQRDGTALSAAKRPADPIDTAIRMMEEVKKKERALAKKEREIRLKEEHLRQLEREILAKMKQLDHQKKQLAELEEKIGEAESARLQKLAKVFESSPPEQGGKHLSQLDALTAARVLIRINSRKAGRLWAYVDSKKAVEISRMLVKFQAKFPHKIREPSKR